VADGLHLALCVVFGWKEMMSFKDCKWMVEELKDFFFKTLDLWTTAFDLNISSYHVFLDLFASSS
jgi:hypothetical protein